MSTEETGSGQDGPDLPLPGMPEAPAREASAARWQRRPVPVEARKLTEDADWDAIAAWCGGDCLLHEAAGGSGEAESFVRVPTARGTTDAYEGNWIVRSGLTFAVWERTAFLACHERVPPPFGENPATDECGCGPDEPCEEHAEPPLPDGIWGRVELPGMRSDTGWITDGTRGGQAVLVVRDWDGRPKGEYVLGPACRLVHLPTPLKRPDPEPQRALSAGRGFGYGSDDDWDERNPF